jgi:hypothetical protein
VEVVEGVVSVVSTTVHAALMTAAEKPNKTTAHAETLNELRPTARS